MKDIASPSAIDRRRFLQDAGLFGGAVLATACAGSDAGSRTIGSESLSARREKIGLQLFTVRDKFPADFEGTLMNAINLFKRYPGRFEVWHVKDIKGLAALRAIPRQQERQRTAEIVQLGLGDFDYRPMFAAAKLAGMQYFYVEQDSAPQSGDSLAAAAASYRNLVTIFS